MCDGFYDARDQRSAISDQRPAISDQYTIKARASEGIYELWMVGVAPLMSIRNLFVYIQYIPKFNFKLNKCTM